MNRRSGTDSNATVAIPKARGRPAGKNAVDIRGAILDAAEVRFARQGYAGTSVRDIADDVQVNSAMIHYYFGSKLALLRQVLERTMEPLADAIAGLGEAGQAPAADIARLLIRTLRKRPNLPPLVVREVMLPGGVMQQHFVEYLAPRLGGAMPSLLSREQAEGRMNADLDPRISTLLLLSISIFPFVVRETAERALHVPLDEGGLARLERHIEHVLERGFSP